MVYQDTITVETQGHGHMHPLDDALSAIVRTSGVQDGLVNLFNIGSTGAIVMIEYEPGLERDLPEILNKLIPPGREYGHELAWHDGNAHSHLQASILGPSLTVPVESGHLQLGTWQQVIHLECDNKPRHRVIKVTVYGE